MHLLYKYSWHKGSPFHTPTPLLINTNINVYYRECKHTELVKKPLALHTLPQLFSYLLLFASCLLSVMLFFCLISCEGANYPAAYQLKTMLCAKGASIICEQRAKHV